MKRDRNYYDVLGVPRDATADQIRAAHRKLVRELHPDVNKAPDAAERFNEVQTAYDVLGDDDKRKAYDRVGHRAYASGHTASSAHPGGASGFRWTSTQPGGAAGAGGFDFDLGNMGSIFEEMFGGRRTANPYAPGAQQRSRSNKGADLHHDVEVPFDVALRGGTRSIRIARGGASQTIDVTIPKGIADGAKLRVKGVGHPSAGGGLPGDLIVTVRVADHPLFRRDGLDVLLDLPVTIVEATLGATVKAPTPAGEVELKVPPATASGSKLRIRGKGAEDDSGRRGDFLAIIKIVPPKELTERQRESVEKLGKSLPSPRVGDGWPE